MRVYDVGGVSDAELIKTKTKTRARVAPPLTAAEQRHVAERLTAAHADLALWRACERKACGRRRRCGGDVDQCGARRAPRVWACVHEILAAIRAGKAPRVAARVAGRRAMPPRQRYVFGYGDPPEWIEEQHADGTWRIFGEGEPPSQLTLQLRRLRAGSARWMRAVGGRGKVEAGGRFLRHGALVSRPSAQAREPGSRGDTMCGCQRADMALALLRWVPDLVWLAQARSPHSSGTREWGAEATPAA